jgi:hypothetical protein
LGVTGLAMLAGLNGARRRRTAGDPAEA